MPSPLFSWIEGHQASLWLISAGLLLVLLIWVVFLQIRLSQLTSRYHKLMLGGDGKSLEEMFDGYLDQAQATANQVQELQRMTQQLQHAAELSLKHVGVVRYDAFPDVGGKQSFALALADSHGDGIIISSVASRQATRTYGKPLQKWQADYSLSAEEKEAVTLASRH